MKRFIYNFAICIITALMTVSCSDKDEPQPTLGPGDIEDGGTVLVYMVATNNLGQSHWDQLDINEMLEGMKTVNTKHPSRLLVYHAASSKKPELKQINRDGTVTTLKTYTDADPSVSIARMRQVIADASTSPTLPLRGLVLWSHGTGWLEESSCYRDPEINTLSFGYDTGGKRMSVPALAEALKGLDLHFIYFDCCLMGTVEVAYEVRHSTREIVACATELPLEGMPYDVNVHHFFSGKADAMRNAAMAAYEFYMSPEATTASAAMVVINADALDDLAAQSRYVMQSGAIVPDTYRGIPLYRSNVTPVGSYDMGHYYNRLGAGDAWQDAYNRTVAFHIATPTSWGLSMVGFTGLGSGVFSSADDFRITYGYRNLQWFKDVVSYHPVFAQQQ